MLSYFIIKISRNLKNRLNKELSEFGVTSAQFSVMNQIDSMDNMVKASEIATALCSDRPTISAIVHRLYMNGMIEKIDDNKDRRSQFIRLSKKGQEKLIELRLIADDVSEELFQHISDADKKNLMRTLHQINSRLEEYND
ncbi:MAG: MarR family transcriptional regulator [Acidaminobacteraceae bacterium]